MKSSNIIIRATVATVFFAATSLYSHAQAGTAEVAAGGGFASYHAHSDTSNKGKFDASVSFNPLNILSIGFEYGYTPISSETISGGGSTASASASLQSYGGVARVGLLHETRLQPYVLFAGGDERASATASESGNGSSISATASENGGYVGGGVGLNARLGGGFGVRPEVRYQYIAINGQHLNEFDFTGSVYYTFGGRHKK